MYKYFQSLRNNESGFTTAALFMILMPLAVAMIGFSFDFARIAYIKSDLQGNADLAVQSASNIGYLDNGRIVLGRPGDTRYSAEQAEAIYCANSNHRNDCPSITNVRVVGSPLTLAELCSPIAAGQSYGLRLLAVETIDTVFLKILGIPTFTLDIESTALVRPRTC